MAVAFEVRHDSTLDALAASAVDLFGDDGVSRTLDGFTAMRGSVRDRDILSVSVDSTASGSLAEIVFSHVSWPRDLLQHVPLALLRGAAERGVSGTPRSQVRSGAPADDCPQPGAWETEVPDLPDPAASGPETQYPELIGGLEGVQRRVDYPGAARRAGIQGISIVRFIVDETGRVTCAETITALPGGLDEAALAAVTTSECVPGLVDGEPVKVQFMLPISFRLR